MKSRANEARVSEELSLSALRLLARTGNSATDGTAESRLKLRTPLCPIARSEWRVNGIISPGIESMTHSVHAVCAKTGLLVFSAAREGEEQKQRRRGAETAARGPEGPFRRPRRDSANETRD